ncbi:MAG TPA: hypothetical protein VGH89_18025 [Pseudonocardia sp.]
MSSTGSFVLIMTGLSSLALPVERAWPILIIGAAAVLVIPAYRAWRPNLTPSGETTEQKSARLARCEGCRDAALRCHARGRWTRCRRCGQYWRPKAR